MKVEEKIKQWCSNHGWTEARQLGEGLWVAFPPGGVIETPLPAQCQQELPRKTNNMQIICAMSLLILVTLLIGAISLVMSPFFINPIIKDCKNRT